MLNYLIYQHHYRDRESRLETGATTYTLSSFLEL
jgi:hypothetical protein